MGNVWTKPRCRGPFTTKPGAVRSRSGTERQGARVGFKWRGVDGQRCGEAWPRFSNMADSGVELFHDCAPATRSLHHAFVAFQYKLR